MRKKPKQSTLDMQLHVRRILAGIRIHLREFKKEMAYKVTVEDALESKHFAVANLDLEVIEVIRKKNDEAQTQSNHELYFQNNEWHQYREEEIQVRGCYLKILARIESGEDFDDIEYDTLTDTGFMEDRDWTNPHWGNYKNRMTKNACFYCACAIFFDGLGDDSTALSYLLLAAEMKGVMSRLAPEANRGKWGAFQSIETASITHKARESEFKKTKKKTSVDANDVKNDDYLIRVNFAKQKWVDLPDWHMRSAVETADKLIKDFKKEVPAKNNLRRLIKVWQKQQLKN